MSLPRPYTSYNLFSQLEREYILQKLLGVTPTVSRAELFDPNNYPDMPPLPPRYNGLILLWDWHLPGKQERRKRKHRKSHGKISFQELNQQISQAWSVADDDVRNFCMVLTEIESQKYKKIMKEEKKKQRKIKALKAKEAKASAKKEQTSNFPDFDWTVNIDEFPRDDFTLSLAGSHCVVESTSTDKHSRISLFGLGYENLSPQTNNDGNIAQVDMLALAGSHCVVESTSKDKPSRISSFGGGYENFSPQTNNDRNIAQVDMSDDEIINAWNIAQVDMSDEEIINAWRSINETPAAAMPTLNTSPQDEGRNSYIDAEYERFVNLGKEFKAKKRRSSLPTCPRRLTMSSRQA